MALQKPVSVIYVSMLSIVLNERQNESPAGQNDCM